MRILAGLADLTFKEQMCARERETERERKREK